MNSKDKIAMLGIEILQFNMLFRDFLPDMLEGKKIMPHHTAAMEALKGHLEKATKLMGEAIEKAKEEMSNHAYIVVTNIFGDRQMIECADKEACLDMANSFHGNDGKAYIFTNDLTVGGREEKAGGTIICETVEDVRKKAEIMMNSQS